MTTSQNLFAKNMTNMNSKTKSRPRHSAFWSLFNSPHYATNQLNGNFLRSESQPIPDFLFDFLDNSIPRNPFWDNTKRPAELMDLPNEVLANVLSFCRPDDLKNVSLVSKRLSVGAQEELQRNLLVLEIKTNFYLQGSRTVKERQIQYNANTSGAEFANYTLISYASFERKFGNCNQKFVKRMHFVDPFKRVSIEYLEELIKTFPRTRIILDGNNSLLIRRDPSMRYNDRVLESVFMSYLVNSMITGMCISSNVFPGEVLYTYLLKFPQLARLSIDKFVIGTKIELPKLRLEVLRLTGDEYSYMFEVIESRYLRRLEIEKPDFQQIPLLKLDELVVLSFGSINDDEIHLLNAVSSTSLRWFSLLWPYDNYDKLEATKLKLQEALCISQVEEGDEGPLLQPDLVDSWASFCWGDVYLHPPIAAKKRAIKIWK